MLFPHRLSLAFLLLGLALLLPGCGKSKPPQPNVQARQSLNQANDAISDMKKKVGQTKQDLKQLRQRSQQMLHKHLALINQRLSDLKQRVTDLPTDAEATMRQRWAQLQNQADRVKTLAHRWLKATGDQADKLRQQLDDARSKLQAAFKTFRDKLADAEKQAAHTQTTTGG